MSSIARDTLAGMVQRPVARALLTVALLTLGLAGNVLNVPLVYGVNFVFGSVAAMLALALLGLGPALVVALAGGLYTLLLWGHPYALPTALVEVAAVALLRRRGMRNLVLADLLFWMGLGLVWVLLSYRLLLGMEWQSAWMVALKQSLNGVFNTLLAGIVLQVAQLGWRGAQGLKLPPPRLGDLLFSALLTAVLLAGSVPVILHNHDQRAQQEAYLLDRMRDLGQGVIERVAATGNGLEPAVWVAALEFEHPGAELGLALTDESGREVLSRGQVASLRAGVGRLLVLGKQLSVWMPDGEMSMMTRWARGRYRVDMPIALMAPGSRLVIERPARPLVKRLEADNLRVFQWLTMLLLLGVGGSLALSHGLARPLMQLDRASSDLSAQIAQGREPLLPDHPVQEYGRLASTLRDMSARLAASFRELHQIRDDLERLVLARTAELNQFKSTLDRTLDGVMMFDAESLQLFYVNEGAQRLSGHGRDELLGMRCFELMVDLDEAGFRERIAPLRSGAQLSQTFETRLRRKQGEAVPVETLLQYVAPEGEPARFIIIVRDITERRRVERMKSEFVSTVSHELRTPLTSITGALGLIEGGVLGEMPPKASQMISIAHKNSQRLTLLINDLLDMERLSVGKLSVVLKPQPLEPLLEQSIADIQGYGAARRVRIVLQPHQPGLLVNVDGQRLVQVLTNLLSNAVKFSPDGAGVEVAVNAVGERVRVSVVDQGPGIPEAFHSRVFEKFAQADASDTRKLGGSGLGLAIARELVCSMAGEIGFESREGGGTTFYFELPLVEQNRQQPVAAVRPEDQGDE